MTKVFVLMVFLLCLSACGANLSADEVIEKSHKFIHERCEVDLTSDSAGWKYTSVPKSSYRAERSENTWSVWLMDVPEDIKRTFDRLGIPDAEQKWLGGVTAQYESEAVYHSIREDLEAQGVIFLDMDSGLREHEDLVKEYFC